MAYNFTDKTDDVDDVLAAHINAIHDALEAHEFITAKAATEKTISSGVLAADQAVHKVQPESGTADDLDTISGLDTGDILILYVSDEGTDTITIKHGTGNISCMGDADVALSEGAAIFFYDGTTVYLIGGGGADANTQIYLSAVRVYTANDTWSKPSGLHHVIAEVVGGGGGGGGVESDTAKTAVAGGGGGGGYSKKFILAASLGATETVTVGAAGAAGAAGDNNGSAGGTSSFGSHLQATGGSGGGGQGYNATVPRRGSACGAAGVGSNGDINAGGGVGANGVNLAVAGSGIVSGGGGNAIYGSGGPQKASAGAGNPGTVYGGGGSGACSEDTLTDYAGGAGAAGVVIVYEYLEG